MNDVIQQGTANVPQMKATDDLTRRRWLQAALALSISAALITTPARAEEPIKVVYHVADGTDQATRALGNIRNELRAAPGTKIVVVALADGIKLLLKDAAERDGKPFEPQVAALVEQGVEFRVCMNSLAAHDIALSRVISVAKPVPSGVAEIA
ncbi:MAG: DsrE family protein [Pseudomonadota bacterium]|nr:DsrE family protein [Pseudomonadota bacterium]